MFFWITFKNHLPGTVKADNAEAASEEAAKITGKEVVDAQQLPYPSTPYLHPIEHPAFCHSPRACAGRSSCPQRYACDN